MLHHTVHWVLLCCRMVDSIPRWRLSLFWPIQSDHLSITDWMILPSWKAGPGKVMTVENICSTGTLHSLSIFIQTQTFRVLKVNHIAASLW